MKNLIMAAVLLCSISAKAQLATTVKLTEPVTTVALQVDFVYPPGFLSEPIPVKKGANNKTYVIVSNESKPDLSRFEINIFSGNKKLSKATGLVCLSITSANKQQLSNGNYKYSDKDPSERENYRFSGSVKVGSFDVPVTGGTFQVNAWNKRIFINYNLTLKNGVKTTGNYDTSYEFEDRSEQKGNSGMTLTQQ